MNVSLSTNETVLLEEGRESGRQYQLAATCREGGPSEQGPVW